MPNKLDNLLITKQAVSSLEAEKLCEVSTETDIF